MPAELNEIKIKTENISLFVQDKQVLNRISLEIPEQCIYAFVGPEAGGKSSLLRCFNRLTDLSEHARTEGAIYLDGQNILAKTTDVRKLRLRMGMVFQQPNLFPFSVADNIRYVLKLKGIRNRSELQDRTEDALKKTGLFREVHDTMNRPAKELNLSQRQRLSIARAIAIEPEILLLDDPMSLLDPLSTQVIEELFLELKDNYTILMVTHNLKQAARLSDMTAFIYNGTLIEQGPTNRFFTSPGKELTQKYVSGKFG